MLEGWTARIDGSAAALLLDKHSAVGAEIYWLAVGPDRRRQGIGRALIDTDEGRLPFAYSLKPLQR